MAQKVTRKLVFGADSFQIVATRPNHGGADICGAVLRHQTQMIALVTSFETTRS